MIIESTPGGLFALEAPPSSPWPCAALHIWNIPRRFHIRLQDPEALTALFTGIAPSASPTCGIDDPQAEFLRSLLDDGCCAARRRQSDVGPTGGERPHHWWLGHR